MAFFKIGDPGEFLISMWGFRKTLEATGSTSVIGRIQYLHTALHVESLCEFDTLSESIGPTTNIFWTHIFLCHFESEIHNASRNEELIHSKNEVLCSAFE